MSRETRLNLIVLAILLAVLTPAGVILFRKKLQPTVRPMFMPHAVQREVAYMSPLETPPGKTRVEPPHTAKWIESLVRERIGDRKVVRPTDSDGLPLMSDKRTFELLATDVSGEAFRIWIIRWSAADRLSMSWSLTPSETEGRWQVVESAIVPVPPIVREELGEAGVTLPPHEIGWLAIEFPRPETEKPVRLRHTWDGSQDFVNFVPSFTNSAATGN